jgi:hypothetical protein
MLRVEGCCESDSRVVEFNPFDTSEARITSVGGSFKAQCPH